MTATAIQPRGLYETEAVRAALPPRWSPRHLLQDRLVETVTVKGQATTGFILHIAADEALKQPHSFDAREAHHDGEGRASPKRLSDST